MNAVARLSRRAVQPASLIASWFGIGYLPRAPGTWGSLAALPFAWAIAAAWGPRALLAASLALFLAGWAAATAVLAESPVRDPGWIVVDEVAGQWLTLAFVPPDPLLYAAGFLLFRLFDIAKPWPISVADARVRGGLGVMLDDGLAGIAAAAVLTFGRRALGGG